MTLDEISKKLELQGNQMPKRGWTREDTNGEETFGLNFTKVQEIARELESDPAFADELYSSGNHDLKVLATFIDDPKSYTLDELNKRAEQLYPSPFAEKFCRQVLAKSDHAVHFVDKWSECADCDYRCYAFYILSELAKKTNRLSNEFYARFLEDIAAHIHEETDTVKEAMQQAIVAIGARDKRLQKLSKEIAEQIGKVPVTGSKKALEPIKKLEKVLH